MPTYVYECRKCGHRFEIFHGVNEPPPKCCPECRGAVRRVVTPGGGLIFKGSGFYITDYRKKEYREKERKEKADSASSSSESSKPSSADSSADSAKKPAKGGGS